MKASHSTLQTLKAQGVFVYDNSMLQTWLKCPREFYYRHELGLQRQDAEMSVALYFGIAVHIALEEWFGSRDEDKARQLFEDSFTGHEEKPKIGKRGYELTTTYSLNFGCSLLQEYFDTYSADTRLVLQNEVAVAEEIADGVFLAGVLDKLLESPVGLVDMEHKTSKYSDNFRLNPNPQFLTYNFLASKLTGETVTGELDMLGVSKTKEPAELLRREPFEYTDWQKRQWERSAVEHCRRINEARERSFWPQSWECDSKYFQECSFVPLCTLPSEAPHDALVQSMYEVDYWDPLGAIATA